MASVQVAAAVGALIVAASAGWFTNGWRMQSEIDRLVTAHVNERNEANAAALKEQTARFLMIQKVNDAETIRSQARAADRRAADVAGGGLRFRADATAQAARSAAAAGECKAASAAADLFANVLSRMEEAGRQLAATADERGDSGATCEAFGDALTVAPRSTK